jgi:hypothetical protein
MFGSIIYVKMLNEFHTNQDKKNMKMDFGGVIFLNTNVLMLLP